MTNPPFIFHIGAVRGQIFTDGVGVSAPEVAAARYPDHVEQMRTEIGDAPVSGSRNVLLLDSGSERILIDTGEGKFNAVADGLLIPALRDHGVDLGSITTVILTHFHMDHIGGLLTEEGTPTFPNARLIAAQAEHDHWLNEATLAALPADRAAFIRSAFAAYPRVELVTPPAEVLPGITLLPAYGHSPGQCAVLIESERECLLHIADSWHIPAQLNLPEARIKFDAVPEQAIASRRALMGRAEQENLLTLGYHFEFPGLGHVLRAGKRRVWIIK